MTPEIALQLATFAHQGQTDKLGKDYIDHPKRVANVFSDPDMRMVAYLHDVIEDTKDGSEISPDQAKSFFSDKVSNEIVASMGKITAENLRSVFSDSVVDAVVVLTKVKGQHTYDEYLELVKSNDIALAVKLADVADNQSRLGQLSDLDLKERLTEKYLKAEAVLGRK